MYTLQICLNVSASPEEVNQFITAGESFFAGVPAARGGVLRSNSSALDVQPFAAAVQLTAADESGCQLLLATSAGKELNKVVSGLHKVITIIHFSGILR